MNVEETFRRSLYTSYGENKCILLPKDEYIKTVGELLEATQFDVCATTLYSPDDGCATGVKMRWTRFHKM